MLNIFTINEKYPKDGENRLTASFMFLLSECRQTLLPKFLEEKLGIDKYEAKNVSIEFQIKKEGERGIPDAKISYSNEFYVLIEAKIGTNTLNKSQLEKYTKSYLDKSTAKTKKLLCLTQTKQDQEFEKIVADPRLANSDVTFCYLKWSQVADFIKSTMEIDDNKIYKKYTKIKNYKDVNYEKRLCLLFLTYMADRMYDKQYEFVDVNESLANSGIEHDIAVVVENPLGMYRAKKHNLWLPSWSKSNITPTKYVAYYETKEENGTLSENENPGYIAYIAKVIKYWTHITIADAKEIDELKSFFNDPLALEGWKDTDFGNFAKTEEPEKLNKPIRKGKNSNMNAWGIKHANFIKFMKAETTDDLLKT